MRLSRFFSITGVYRCIESSLESWYDYESALIFYSNYMIFFEIVNSLTKMVTERPIR